MATCTGLAGCGGGGDGGGDGGGSSSTVSLAAAGCWGSGATAPAVLLPGLAGSVWLSGADWLPGAAAAFTRTTVVLSCIVVVLWWAPAESRRIVEAGRLGGPQQPAAWSGRPAAARPIRSAGSLRPLGLDAQSLPKGLEAGGDKQDRSRAQSPSLWARSGRRAACSALTCSRSICCAAGSQQAGRQHRRERCSAREKLAHTAIQPFRAFLKFPTTARSSADGWSLCTPASL